MVRVVVVVVGELQHLLLFHQPHILTVAPVSDKQGSGHAVQPEPPEMQRGVILGRMTKPKWVPGAGLHV